MKRWIVIVLALVAALFAAGFALLNEAVVHIDFHFFAVDVSLGLVVMASLFTGFLLASAALAIAVIIPQRLRLRSLQRQLGIARQGGQAAP